MTVELYLGDCLEILPTLAKVDAIITDIPYGTTACSWDEVIPFDEMWEQVKRVTGVFITTASQPFTSKLVMSNLDWFKYEWAWNKNTNTCFVHAKHRPLGAHENILVFGNGKVLYNPQMIPGKPYYRGKVKNDGVETAPTKKGKVVIDENKTGLRYPKTVLNIDGNNRLNHKHPTQKPIELYEYLIRTYTNEGDTVLDIAMGSGTTGVACVQTGRNFIGIEIDPKYFEIAEARIAEAKLQIRMEI